MLYSFPSSFSIVYFNVKWEFPLYDYIRKRRLASAASLLLNTDESILNIALVYQFVSQEAQFEEL